MWDTTCYRRKSFTVCQYRRHGQACGSWLQDVLEYMHKNEGSALNEICLFPFLSEYISSPITFKEVGKHINKRMCQCLPSVIRMWERFNHLAQLPCPIQSLDLLVTADRFWTNVLTEGSPLVLLPSQWDCLIKGEKQLGMQTSFLRQQELAVVNISCKALLGP